MKRCWSVKSHSGNKSLLIEPEAEIKRTREQKEPTVQEKKLNIR